jgi:protein-disulfide isomerase
MASLSPRTRLAAGVVVTAVAVLIVGLVSRPTSRVSPRSAGTPDTVAVRAGSADLFLAERTVGDSRAPVTIWEVSDFQCPFCRDFWRDVLPALEREYVRPGKVRLVYVNSPIPELHPNARRAHEFAMCAAREKRFWPYHDLLYRHQQDWARLPDPAPYFRGLADSAGVSPRAIGQCLESKAMERLVTAEAEGARRAGISSTPSFLIEGTLIRGTFPLKQWRPILDSIYAARVRSGQ